MVSYLRGLGLHLEFRIQRSPGLHCIILKWQNSASFNWRHTLNEVRFGMQHTSSSSLGPLSFVVYASKIFEIVVKQNLEIHSYTDDSQLSLSFCLSDNANQEAALARSKGVLKTFVSGYWTTNFDWTMTKLNSWHLTVCWNCNYHSCDVCKELGLMVWFIFQKHVTLLSIICIIWDV